PPTVGGHAQTLFFPLLFFIFPSRGGVDATYTICIGQVDLYFNKDGRGLWPSRPLLFIFTD
ncbi:MAG: hypothetical protein LBI58_01470, partial [Tannerellaceae bacterium]|nr:hypothetical protein [Tannerellaceae bacterium]